MRASVLFLAAAVLSTGLFAHATTVTQLTSPNQLSPGDTSFVIPDPNYTVYAGNSVSYNSAGLTFSRTNGAFEVDQAGVTYFGTAFANGTKLLGAGGYQDSADEGPITLTFATPVTQFGLNIEEFNSGPYTVAFTAFDSAGTGLGTFFASGSDPSGNGVSLLSFEGLLVSGDSIAKVTFNDLAAGGSNDLLFGNVVFGQTPAATATPEPSGFILLGSGLLGLAGVLRRRVA